MPHVALTAATGYRHAVARRRCGRTPLIRSGDGRPPRIAGFGGTGCYILDFVAKTSVAEIHIFDRDLFSQHNAFRSPGAASIEELRAKPPKVARFAKIYSNMHRGIIVHNVFLEAHNVALLDGLDFVFVCIDVGSAKRAVIEHLVANGTPFIDVGMGVVMDDGRLSGIVRTTTSTADTRDSAAPLSPLPRAMLGRMSIPATSRLPS